MKNFELPSFWVNKILALATHNQGDLHDAIIEAHTVLDAIDTTMYVGSGVHVYECLSEPVMDRFRHDSATMDELIKIRELMLVELFTNGLIIQHTIGRRSRVELVDDAFRIIDEGIGQYRDWCWIDQGRTTSVPKGEPLQVLVELVRLHEERSHH